MAENMKSRLLRWQLNWFPCYRRTGARITYIATDMHEVRVELALNWKTKNIVGTLFAGSMYGAVDPVYMVMLIKILGKNYIVWDKSANMRFKKPGRETLYARFVLSPDEIETIKTHLLTQDKIDRHYLIELVDKTGVVHAEVEKIIHISNKQLN